MRLDGPSHVGIIIRQMPQSYIIAGSLTLDAFEDGTNQEDSNDNNTDNNDSKNPAAVLLSPTARKKLKKRLSSDVVIFFEICYGSGASLGLNPAPPQPYSFHKMSNDSPVKIGCDADSCIGKFLIKAQSKRRVWQHLPGKFEELTGGGSSSSSEYHFSWTPLRRRRLVPDPVGNPDETQPLVSLEALKDEDPEDYEQMSLGSVHYEIVMVSSKKLADNKRTEGWRYDTACGVYGMLMDPDFGAAKYVFDRQTEVREYRWITITGGL